MNKQDKFLELNKLESELESLKEIYPILNQDLKKIDKKEIINVLFNIIDSIEINEECVLINLNKTLILKAKNLVQVAENLSIHLTGNKLHLNPVLDINQDEHLKQIEKLKKEIK